jgi:predicted ATP-grasp superfamily ATP-dependent carboligase
MNRQNWARLNARLGRLATGKTPAIIVGDGSTNDLSFVRSLSRHGIPTILIVGRCQLGSFSRYGLRIRMPAVEDEPQAWLEVLEVAASLLRASPILFALSDAHCAFVSRNTEWLRRSFRFLLPDEETVKRILDKQQQYSAAEAAGIKVPPTLYPKDIEDLVRLASEIDYPVILKPYTAHLGRPMISNRKVLILQSADELIAAYSNCTASGSRFMVQKIIAGDDDAIFWYSGFWDKHRREQAWFTVQKLRQFPPGFGDGSFQRTLEVPEVLQQSRRLLDFFRYRGLVMVEFKRDARDGSYNLMEINPRTVSGNQLGISAGVDLPWIAYRNLAGLDPADTLQRPFRPNVKYVNEEWDVQAFAALRKSKELTLIDWIRSLRGTRALALFAWDDPLPLLVGLWRFLCICFRGALSWGRYGSK